MNAVTRLIPVVAGLVLLLTITPSWGQLFINPTASDANVNTAGGTGALQNVVSGASGGLFNTAFGFDALLSNTTGDGNTASGADALFSNTTGNANTASGTEALFSNTTGIANTASGVNALFNNTTGSDNTATGGGSLLGNATGNKNTAVGVAALQQSRGNRNIAIGFKAGVTLVNGNNNIYIGNQGAGDESQTIRIGTAQTQTFIAGIATTPIVANGATVEIDTTTGQLGLGLQVSSARYKRDIAPMGIRSEGVLRLRPVTFAYKNDAQGRTHYGLVAEEVAAVFPELVTHTATGEVQTVRYQELIPMLLNELQRQRQELQHQHQELAELRALVGQRRETAASAR